MDTRAWTMRVKEYMKVHHMAETGDGILAAVSGGADSVCLLLVLEELADELGIRLAAFHLNHCLRGDEADRDEAYVRRLCEEHAIPLKVAREDVRRFAAENGMSEEEAGRVLRYRHLEETAKEFGCNKIATAHHSDDHAETVLMNLFRGSGLKGLGGIQPVRGSVIRPLLQVTRQEIETYLYKKKVIWCEDSTNQEVEYGRNKVRNVLLPWVQEHVNGQACAHIVKTAAFASQADVYFSSLAEKILEEGGNGCELPVRLLDAQPEIVKAYLVRALIKRAAKSEKDLSSRHIEAVCALTGPGGGTEVDLPYGLKAVRGYETIKVVRQTRKDTDSGRGSEWKCDGPVILQIPETGTGRIQRIMWKDVEISIEIRVFPWKKDLEIPKNQYTKWFDYDKIKGTLSIRTRETGDYYMIGGEKRKRLNRFFVDEKVPEAVRGEIPLLADEDHILWIIGYRISEYYKVTDATRTVLEVRIHKGERNG